MRLFTFLISIFLFISCTTETKTEKVKKNVTPPRAELSEDSKVFFGNRLFSEKTCITCHAVNKKKIGPSIVDIVKVYKQHNANIVGFLRGQSKPIVDTVESQVFIMQTNIDGFLKKVTDEELDAISTYMLHVTELNKK